MRVKKGAQVAVVYLMQLGFFFLSIHEEDGVDLVKLLRIKLLVDMQLPLNFNYFYILVRRSDLVILGLFFT